MTPKIRHYLCMFPKCNAILKKKRTHCVLPARLQQAGKGCLINVSMRHGSKTRPLLPHAHWEN